MALLFSKVTVTAGNDATSFLVGGIPREYDDLEDWDEFDDFLKYIDEETEVLAPIQIPCGFPHGLNLAAVSLPITVKI